jgi:hypothetical protein
LLRRISRPTSATRTRAVPTLEGFVAVPLEQEFEEAHRGALAGGGDDPETETNKTTIYFLMRGMDFGYNWCVFANRVLVGSMLLEFLGVEASMSSGSNKFPNIFPEMTLARLIGNNDGPRGDLRGGTAER